MRFECGAPERGSRARARNKAGHASQSLAELSTRSNSRGYVSRRIEVEVAEPVDDMGDAMRRYRPLDHLLIEIGRGLRATRPAPRFPTRPSPAETVPDPIPPLVDEERRRSGALMRVNHAGEVAAQALYHGQALGARQEDVRRTLLRAAEEENDHLDWCAERVSELGARTSRLTGAWYLGSLAIGVAAGAAGDRISLGFLAETEGQVVRHLEDHLERLPERDAKSRAILEAMRREEAGHASTALAAGAPPLPYPVRRGMRSLARVMTFTAYRI